MHFMIYVYFFIPPTYGFWWWFTANQAPPNEMSDDESSSGATTTEMISSVFAPFEMTSMEEKFLAGAKNYLQNLPMLDQCNMLIINRLKTSCTKLSDEEMSRLSVNLLNCQSAVEGRKTFKCTDDMALSDCTGQMDSDVWNSYHIISNRARAICYNIRQTQFRMKTEQTVNKLASSTLDNINLLQKLAIGQQKVQEATDDAMTKISQSQDQLLTNQNDLHEKQERIGSALNNNMNDIIREKRFISLRHKQVEAYTKMINSQLASLLDEFQAQDLAKKKSEKEILKDLDSVKSKADEVLNKLGDAFKDMDSFHDNLEGKQNKTLKNLEEIQQSVAFMNQILQKLYFSFHEQMPWLHHIVGGTMDKLTMASCILSHVAFFVLSFFAILFVDAPSITRVLLLCLVPGNCIASLHSFHYQLSYLQMGWVLAGSVPVFYILKGFHKLVMYKWNVSLVVATKERNQTPTKFPFPSPVQRLPLEESTNLSATDLTPILSTSKQPRLDTYSPTVRNLQFPTEEVDGDSVDRFNTSSCSLNTTIGGSIKCKAKTKTGLRCRNSAFGCGGTCRVHTPKKYFS